jgi:hypothetical protein
MTRMGKGAGTPEQCPKGKGVVKPPEIVLVLVLVLVLEGWGVSQRNRWTDFVDPLA